MIHEQARVTAVKGNKVIIQVQKQQGCQSCELSGGCGTSSLGRLLGYRASLLTVDNDQQLKIGDKVMVSLAEEKLVSAGLLVYLLPLITLFLFAGLAEVVFASVDGLNVVAALIGLFTGLKLSAWVARHFYSQQFKPVIKRLIG